MSGSADLEELKTSNATRIQLLQTDGVVFNHPLVALEVMQHRVESFIDWYFTGFPEGRNEYELLWEQRVSEILERYEADVRKAKITAGMGHEQLSMADGGVLSD